MKPILYALSLALPAAAQGDFRPLFNGRDLSGWSVVLENAALGKDPQGMVTVHDGLIHMYQNVKGGELAPFGYITSDKSYSRFHLRFQYRWMGKKFAPRAGDLRDAGVIYHAYEFNKVWSKGIESQVQEGDVGDLIWCDSNGVTWLRPAGQYAPEGQGQMGLLPENGGIMRETGFKYDYIGRFEEYDNYDGWNHVEVIAQADEWAVHKVNGRVRTRLRNFKKPDGSPLTGGRLTFQLEGAELQYRGIEVKELTPPLRASLHQVTLISTHGKPGEATLTLTNPGTTPADAAPRLLGKDAEFFSVEPATATLAAGASAEFKVRFSPQGYGGRCTAGIQFGGEQNGAFVPVNAIGHGDGTQPTLQEIIDTLAIPVTATADRTQDDKTPRMGESIHARSFISTKDNKAFILALAAFPDGDDKKAVNPELSLFTEVDPTLKPLHFAATAAGVNPEVIAKAQAGMLSTGDFQEFAAPDSAFGLCLGDSASTDPDRPSTSPLHYKARVFKASRVLDSKLTDAYLVCFDTGGAVDYNDAIFLLANVNPWRTPEPRTYSEAKSWTLDEIRKALGAEK